ncbi:MAG: integration host factor subunit beta [Treponema sp.]|nr:integration host factor subunit beta [Treponema sp.]
MAVKKVTKNEIVDRIHAKSKIERKVVLEVFEGVIEEFKDALKDCATVELRGFGTLEPRLRNGRSKARNPRTGEVLSVAPHYVAAFRAGNELRSALMEIPVEKN